MICLFFASVLRWPHGLERRAGSGTAGPRDGGTAGQPLRSAARRRRAGRRPGHRRRRGRARPDRADRVLPRPLAQRHLDQRQPGRPVLGQPQPVPRLRARLHLLLRAADARIPRPVRGPRLRDEDLREGRRARAAAGGAVGAVVAAEGAGDERRHRLLPADRAHAATHAAVPRGAGRVPQSGRHHHQERAGRARRRPARRPRLRSLRQSRCRSRRSTRRCAARSSRAPRRPSCASTRSRASTPPASRPA